MQDKTINNALLALAKAGGTQGRLAEVLLEMRGVGWSGIVQDKPFKRGSTKRIVLNALKERPMSSWELGKVLRKHTPDVGPKSAGNRAYQALKRLSDQGLVVRDGGMWRLV